MARKPTLIVGGAAARSSAAQAIQTGDNVEVIVVGAEDRPPYNRTTVNKGLLSGAVNVEDIGLPGMELPGARL